MTTTKKEDKPPVVNRIGLDPYSILMFALEDRKLKNNKKKKIFSLSISNVKSIDSSSLGYPSIILKSS